MTWMLYMPSILYLYRTHGEWNSLSSSFLLRVNTHTHSLYDMRNYGRQPSRNKKIIFFNFRILHKWVITTATHIMDTQQSTKIIKMKPQPSVKFKSCSTALSLSFITLFFSFVRYFFFRNIFYYLSRASLEASLSLWFIKKFTLWK